MLDVQRVGKIDQCDGVTLQYFFKNDEDIVVYPFMNNLLMIILLKTLKKIWLK